MDLCEIKCRFHDLIDLTAFGRQPQCRLDGTFDMGDILCSHYYEIEFMKIAFVALVVVVCTLFVAALILRGVYTHCYMLCKTIKHRSKYKRVLPVDEGKELDAVTSARDDLMQARDRDSGDEVCTAQACSPRVVVCADSRFCPWFVAG